MISIKCEERPWGRFFVIHDQSTYKLKRIEVDPGGRLSYQFHYKRSEAWTIVEGIGTITLDGETKDYIAKNKIRDLIRSSNRTPIQSEFIDSELRDSLVPIEFGRSTIQKGILKSANEQTSDLGIEILDFRFKRINYVEKVKQRVYERMKSERNNIATKFRSEGQGEASSINGEKERELKTIQSEAFRKAEEVKGDADAEAASIYAAAYNRTSQSKELYGFLKSMETFHKTFDSETSVILSTESDLFRYLKRMK